MTNGDCVRYRQQSLDLKDLNMQHHGRGARTEQLSIYEYIICISNDIKYKM